MVLSRALELRSFCWDVLDVALELRSLCWDMLAVILSGSRAVFGRKGLWECRGSRRRSKGQGEATEPGVGAAGAADGGRGLRASGPRVGSPGARVP